MADLNDLTALKINGQMAAIKGPVSPGRLTRYTNIMLVLGTGTSQASRGNAANFDADEVVDLGLHLAPEYLKPVALALLRAAEGDGTADVTETIDGLPFRVVVSVAG